MDQLIQRLIRWMPLILLFLLFMVDRSKVVHQVGYIVLLLSYTAILILRILYAKKIGTASLALMILPRIPRLKK